MISATAKADIMTPLNAWARHWHQRVNIGYWRTYIYIFYLFRHQLLVVASAKLDVKTLVIKQTVIYFELANHST